MTVAFVIGNGESRKDIDLYSLKNYGKVYACNAVYRHFQPDYLVEMEGVVAILVLLVGRPGSTLQERRQHLRRDIIHPAKSMKW